MMSSNIKSIVQTWFARWESNILPRLFVPGNRKGFQKQRNLQKGDICYLHCKRGKHAVVLYKICRIIEAIPSKDGCVRTVKVCYLNPPSKKRKIICIDVRRLSLIQSICDQKCDPDHMFLGKSASKKLPLSTNPSIITNKSLVSNNNNANKTASSNVVFLSL